MIRVFHTFWLGITLHQFLRFAIPIVYYTTGMADLKIVNASQSLIRRFTSLKKRLYNCNANIYFNRQCLKRKLTPSYARIKIPNTSPAHKHTLHKVTTVRKKDEIKYPYSKKQKQNKLIYHLHLTLANTWSNSWQHIYSTIEEGLQREIRAKYQSMDKKLNRLTQQLTKTPQLKHEFYPRVINKTDIVFSEQEMSLLHKGPKYSLHTKPKNRTQTLALEAETAISHLLPSRRT